MLAASLERISIGLLLIREYNIFLLGKLARLVKGTIFLVIIYNIYIYIYYIYGQTRLHDPARLRVRVITAEGSF